MTRERKEFLQVRNHYIKHHYYHQDFLDKVVLFGTLLHFYWILREGSQFITLILILCTLVFWFIAMFFSCLVFEKMYQFVDAEYEKEEELAKKLRKQADIYNILISVFNACAVACFASHFTLFWIWIFTKVTWVN
jgi:hypothetical protein